MRLFADSNIVAPAVRALAAAGHDIVYAGDRESDPGDEVLLNEAATAGRIFLTKDHDIGALVHRDGQAHTGVLLIDDLGDVSRERDLIFAVLDSHGEALADGGFLRAGAKGVR